MRVVRVGRHKIPSDLDEAIEIDPQAGNRQVAGVRPARAKWLKELIWPAWWLWNTCVEDGFVVRAVGRLIREHANDQMVFLEVGCGNMALRAYLPNGVTYNALDIAFSEFQVNRAMRGAREVNIAFASAYSIPLLDHSASLLVCNQVLQQTPQPERIIAEFHRVLEPDGVFICGVANGNCSKYRRKGQHSNVVNIWSFDEFGEFMESRGFVCEKKFMRGWWVPLPSWRQSYHLPISSNDEAENTHFFFVFRRREIYQPAA